jgi:hypothetical protein
MLADFESGCKSREYINDQALYPAKEYHQDFVRRHPDHSYVVANAFPKAQEIVPPVDAGGRKLSS